MKPAARIMQPDGTFTRPKRQPGARMLQQPKLVFKDATKPEPLSSVKGA